MKGPKGQTIVIKLGMFLAPKNTDILLSIHSFLRDFPPLSPARLANDITRDEFHCGRRVSPASPTHPVGGSRDSGEAPRRGPQSRHRLVWCYWRRSETHGCRKAPEAPVISSGVLVPTCTLEPCSLPFPSLPPPPHAHMQPRETLQYHDMISVSDVLSFQALAAIGQCQLMALWDSLFSYLRQPIAQILLTRNDIQDVSPLYHPSSLGSRQTRHTTTRHPQC